MIRSVTARCLTFAIGLAIASPSWSQPKVVELYDGLDPVELLAGREVPGEDALTAEHNGYKFLFASAANRATFEKNPERYEPANGGTCARMGLDTMGIANLFTVHEGRIYLFGSGECHKAFTANPSKYIEPPAPALAVSSDARRRGRALAASVSRAIGGAQLAPVTAFRMNARAEVKGPTGPVSIEQVLLVQLPATLRFERVMPFGTTVTGVNGAEAFNVLMRPQGPTTDARPARARAALATALQDRATHSVLSILKSATARDAEVAAIDAPAGADASLDYLHLRHGGSNITLGVDKSTAQPRVIRYRARASNGMFSTIALELDEYRDVGGARLPHAVRGSADGVADLVQTYTITGWTLNPPLTSESFAPPMKAPGGHE